MKDEETPVAQAIDEIFILTQLRNLSDARMKECYNKQYIREKKKKEIKKNKSQICIIFGTGVGTFLVIITWLLIGLHGIYSNSTTT